MSRITFFLLVFALLLLSQSFAGTSEALDHSGALKSRKVIGVIYFKTDNGKLSKIQRTEIDQITSLVIAQYSPDKIVRVEGFAPKGARRTDSLKASLTRAKSVWNYLKKMESFNSNNLYLTGFSANQSISKLQGERVEIAIYENLFKEKMEIYSSN
jgi:outer membrane protein OmpA-like peptidoglycan-associated protein